MSEIYSVQTDGATITGNTASAEALSDALKPAEKPAATPEATPAPGAGVGGQDSGSVAPEGTTEPPKVSRHDAKQDMRARMLEATQKEAAAKKRADEIEARATRAEAELSELRRRMPSETPKPDPKPAPVSDDSDPAPKEDDFDTYAQFVTATARWGARQEHAEISKRGEAETRKAGFRDWQIQNVKNFNERVSERAKTEPDLTLPESVILLLPKKPFDLDHQMTSDDVIGSYFTNEERGLDLMVYFRDHEDELARIRTLTPGRVPIELARLEGRLNGATTATPAKPEIVRANPPVRPVTAVPPSVDDPNVLPDAALSAIEWGKRREALEERRRKAAR